MGKVLLQDGILLWARCFFRMALFYGQGTPVGGKRAAEEHTGCMRRTTTVGSYGVAVSYVRGTPVGGSGTHREHQEDDQVQLLRSNERQFRGGLVFEAHRLCASLNFRPRVLKKRREK